MALSDGAYFLGSTQALVGLSAPTVVNPPANAIGGYMQQVGAGTLWIGHGISQIPGASGAMMFINSTLPRFEWDGPARFYLYATGASVVTNITFKYSSGMSLPFAG